QIERRAQRPGIDFDDAAQMDTEYVREIGGRLAREFLDDGLQLRISLRGADTGAKANGGGEISFRVCRDFLWNVNIGSAPEESGRHDADDLVVLVNKLKVPSEYSGVAAVIALPELIRQDDDPLRFLPVRRVGFDEPAPQHRRDTELARGVAR